MSDGPNNEEEERSSPSFVRSSEYRTVYSNVFRTRVGAGELTIIFSKLSHLPGINVAGSIIEEQIEVVVAWPQLKILAATLDSLAKAIEAEVGVIPVPSQFLEGDDTRIVRQQEAVRTLELTTEIKSALPMAVAEEAEPQPARPTRRRKPPV